MKNLIVLKITKSLCAFFLIFALLICANPMVLYAEELTETEETTSTEETTETTTEEITTTETTSETTTTETTSEETTAVETTSETTTTETTSEETTTAESTSEETTTEEFVELIAEGEEEEPTGPVASENAADPEDGYKIYRYMINIEYGTLSFYYDWGVWDTDYCMYTAEKVIYLFLKAVCEKVIKIDNKNTINELKELVKIDQEGIVSYDTVKFYYNEPHATYNDINDYKSGIKAEILEDKDEYLDLYNEVFKEVFGGDLNE